MSLPIHVAPPSLHPEEEWPWDAVPSQGFSERLQVHGEKGGGRMLPASK